MKCSLYCGRNICWDGWEIWFNTKCITCKYNHFLDTVQYERSVHTLTNDGPQLISACTTLKMLGSWALTWILNILNNSSCSSQSYDFYMIKAPWSPLSPYAHSILLCYLPLMMCQTCVALLIWAFTALQFFVFLSPWRQLHNTLPIPWQWHFLISGHHVPLLSLFLLSGMAALAFFHCFVMLTTTMAWQLKSVSSHDNGMYTQQVSPSCPWIDH